MGTTGELQSHPSATSDEELVAQVQAGRGQLFEKLMRRHGERVRRVVQRVLKDDAQVDDAVQETFLRAYASLKGFAGLSRFSTWLLRIAVNEALWRKRRAVPHVDVLGLELPHDEAGPFEKAAGKQLGVALEKAVEELPERYKDVFMLRVVDGFSVAETAWVLGVSEEAVRCRAFRANAQLRSKLSEC